MGDMGSMCCCEVVGFFWEFARGTTFTDTTRLVGYSSASLESSYEADGLQVETFDEEQTVSPVPTSGGRIWAQQTVSLGGGNSEYTFYRFTTAGGKTIDGPYTFYATVPNRTAAITKAAIGAIVGSQPMRAAAISAIGGAAYPNSGVLSNRVEVDGVFYAFWLTGVSSYLQNVLYSGENFTFPYRGELLAGYVGSELEGAAYGWDGDDAIRVNGWHVEDFLGITNWDDLDDLYVAGYDDGLPYYGITGVPVLNSGLDPDDENGLFYGVPVINPGSVAWSRRLGVATSAYNSANPPPYNPQYKTWERYNRDTPNYRLLAGTAHTSKYVLAIRQELVSDDVTVTSSTTDPSPPSGATAGTIKTYTRDWETQQSLVIGTFDPDTCGVVEDDLAEPIRTLHTRSAYSQTNSRTVNPAYPFKQTGTGPFGVPIGVYGTFTPAIDTRVWQQMDFPNLSLPSVDMWDISRDGDRWCARVTNSGTATLLVNGDTVQTTTLPYHPGAIAGSLATEVSSLNSWASAYNSDPGFDSSTDWPVPYADWPSKTLAYSIDDNVTNYNKTDGYRWYTISAGVLMAIDGGADLTRAPQSPTGNIDAILYHVEQSYLPYLDTAPNPDRWWIRANRRFRIEFWGGGELKGTTYTRPMPTSSGVLPVFKFAFSHGEYVYAEIELWDQPSNSNLGHKQVWRPRTMEYFYAQGSAYPDLGVSGPTSAPYHNLFRWPLPHNEWSVIEPRAVDWLPMNTP